MPALSRAGPHTFEDLWSLVPGDQKADLIDGVLYLTPPESPASIALFVWLLGLLDGFVEWEELGSVFASRVAFRLDKRNGPEPDIAYVAKARRRVLRRTFVNGPPDLAVEIVEPESVERDYVRKRALY